MLHTLQDWTLHYLGRKKKETTFQKLLEDLGSYVVLVGLMPLTQHSVIFFLNLPMNSYLLDPLLAEVNGL